MVYRVYRVYIRMFTCATSYHSCLNWRIFIFLRWSCWNPIKPWRVKCMPWCRGIQIRLPSCDAISAQVTTPPRNSPKKSEISKNKFRTFSFWKWKYACLICWLSCQCFFFRSGVFQAPVHGEASGGVAASTICRQKRQGGLLETFAWEKTSALLHRLWAHTTKKQRQLIAYDSRFLCFLNAICVWSYRI